MKPQRQTRGDVVALPLAAPAPAPEPLPEPPAYPDTYSPIDLHRRRDGWTAERQHVFLANLAASGSVACAAEAAEITPRSAYRLRNHAKGARFAAAWDAALMTAASRLASVAFERAIAGTPRVVWRNGVPHSETSQPSDRLLMFLLRHLNPAFFARDADPAARAAAIGALQSSYGTAMAALRDVDLDADLLDPEDYHAQPPMRIDA